MPKKNTDINTQSFSKQIANCLKYARIRAGYTTAKEFSEKNNLTLNTYFSHENGTRRMSPEVINQYANLLEVDFNWLFTGKELIEGRNTCHVPMITWEEVKYFPKKIKFYEKKWICSHLELSPISFALVVNDDSMTPIYPKGSIIIVDCNKEAKNGDFAIILNTKNLPIFKQIMHVDNDIYAKSLNLKYDPVKLTSSGRIFGKVIQAILQC